MPTELVPLSQLPTEARQQITADHPAFKAYAAQLEKERGLPAGSYTGAKYELSQHDPLGTIIAEGFGKPPIDPAARGPAPTKGSPAFKGFDPAESMSRPERIAAGVGKVMTDLYRGVGQAAGRVPQSEVDEAAALDKPLMEDPWGLTGAIGGGAIQQLPVFRGAQLGGRALGALGSLRQVPFVSSALKGLGRFATNPYGAAAVSGGAYSAAQPVESGGSRGAQTAIGAVVAPAGQALGEGLKAAVRPAAALASPAIAALADRAEAMGIPLRAADISPSRALSAIQHVLDYTPFSGGHAQREGAQKAFNSRIAQTMGESTDDISEALKTARPRLGGIYDSVLARNNAELDPTVHGQRLLRAFNDFKRVDTSPGKQLSQALDDYLTNLVDPANGQWSQAGKFEMPGPLYKTFRSEAGDLARGYRNAKNSGSNPLGGKLADFYNEVKQTLDHAIRTSSTMTPEDAAAVKLADKQWGNMRTLEKLSPKDASGDVDFTALARVMTAGGRNNVYNRDAMVYGTGDQTLPDLARIGTQFLGRGLPPTALRPWVKKAADVAPMALGAPAVGAGLYSMNAHEEHPVLETLGELGGLALLSKAGGSALNSRWFARGAPSWIQRATSGAEDLLGVPSKVPLAAVTALERRGAPLTFEQGAKE